MLRKIIKIVVVLFILGLLAIAAGAWYFWKRPLSVAARASRLALGKAGLVEGTVSTPSGPMTVWEGGSGPPLVLLHGAGDQAGAWAGLVPELINDYRLLIPDLPGHWHSPPSEGPLSFPVIHGGLVALIEARSSDQPVLIAGNSMGAWIALYHAFEHPQQVALAIAINGGPLLEPNPQVDIFPKTREEAQVTMAGLMGPDAAPIPGFVLDDIVRHARIGAAARFAETAAEMGPYLLDGRLHQLQVPVNLVWGNADQLLTLDYARRVVDQLPAGAELIEIDGCGHVPMRECPAAFNLAFDQALKLRYQPSPEPTQAELAETAETES